MSADVTGDPGLRNRLLPFTLDNGHRIGFYRQLWTGIDLSAIRDITDLATLPCVTKQMYRESFMTQFEHAESHFVSHSTGTTGELTYRHRSLLEAAIIEQLFSVGNVQQSQLAIGIILTNAHHGMAMPFPGKGISIPASTNTDIELQQCVKMLQTTFCVHGRTLRPTYLGGGAVDVALVAQALYASGTDPSATQLDNITVMGPIDEGQRRFIRRAFGSPVYERFSTSEIFGGATRRPGQECFVTDPYVVAEITDSDGAPVRDGEVGRLTMTELYPFVQMQPLIRYVTGDIVERVSEPAPGQLAFRWLGRAEQCVWVTNGSNNEVVLGFRPLADALGLLPTLARRRLRPQLRTVMAFGDPGLPKIGISTAGANGVHIRIGVIVDPRFHPDEAQTVVDRSWETLATMARDPNGIYAAITLAPDRSPSDANVLGDSGPLTSSLTWRADADSGAVLLPLCPLVGQPPTVIEHVFAHSRSADGLDTFNSEPAPLNEVP